MTAHPAPSPEIRHAREAGILCNDLRFRTFVADQLDLRGFVTVTFAAAYLRRFCGIESRRQLDTDLDARRRFDTLKTEFDAFTGRIARPDARPQHEARR